HAVLAPEPELRVPRGIRGGQHPAITSRQELARMERETGDIAVRFPDPFPLALPEDFATGRTGRVFDHRQGVPTGYLDDALQVAGHAHLMDTEYGSCPRSNRPLKECRGHIE